MAAALEKRLTAAAISPYDDEMLSSAMMDKGRTMRSLNWILVQKAILVSVAATLAACATVKVQAPDKPIEINLNVKIDQEVRVRLDKEVEDLIASNPDIF